MKSRVCENGLTSLARISHDKEAEPGNADRVMHHGGLLLDQLAGHFLVDQLQDVVVPGFDAEQDH